ncbi:MAG: hypothetical protein EOM90_05335 [Alphaproteobacteria bacterium]|nr:hypothetical protein [Alphaproteobacteria bacterium]
MPRINPLTMQSDHPGLKAVMLIMALTIFGSSCAAEHETTEICLINNTHHILRIYYQADPPCSGIEISGKGVRSVPGQPDTLLPGKKLCLILQGDDPGGINLHRFIDDCLLRMQDENETDWLPRIRDGRQWNHLSIPGEAGRNVKFILLNPRDDTLERLQELGMIRLIRITEGLTYFLVLTTIVGLIYLKIRYRWFLVLVVLVLNGPVIFYTADFGYFIRLLPDPTIVVPRWLFESTKYFVRFSIPVGTMAVWVYLIVKRFRDPGLKLQ